MPTYYDKNLRKWPYISKWTLLHIPPYHCELQPIEGVWSTVFSLLETNYCMLLRKRLPLKL
ncbi:hypothetical protein RhiirA5_368247 [Rhizophagus irregularis]|uniref:Tc1-like transposase DDE domain-containing protein n=1 Tax=Rhizophagus irregularis TaxID=588596 RepID=A0A2N0NIB9_9GLOM|nr:hypothetical protein RhiirA5_368247 [Rhizophagus irregularis]PKC70248.1 hypothetical protein RhiirA1_414604 [Rhizophagus irregularis]GBC21383.2 hypothetical protein RIR_e60625_A0A2N0NIB9_9GLOM [Rhizophagus irregularis DAOM 181602=DAOM 197198]